MLENLKHWILDDNNSSLSKAEYLYGTRHIIVLLLVAILTVAVYLIFRNKSEKAKRTFFVVCASIFLFFEIAYRVYKLATTKDLNFADITKIILPMYFCSIAVWINIVAIFSNSKSLLNVAPTIGLLATFAYLVYPAVGLNMKYINFNEFYSISSHALGFVVSFSLISLKVSKFEIKEIWKSFLTYGIIIVYSVLLDFVIFPGSDYQYLRNNPLPFSFGKVPYQLVFAIILILYIFSYYLPSFTKYLRQKGAKQQSTNDIPFDIKAQSQDDCDETFQKTNNK